MFQRSRIALALAAILLPAQPLLARAPRAPQEEGLDRHRLRLRFDLDQGRLEASDELTTGWRPQVRLRLHPAVEISKLTCADRPLRRRAVEGTPGTWLVTVPRACARDGHVTLDIEYAGRIADPVESEASSHFVTGDRTSGLISTEGVFLDSGSGHFADTGALATFDLVVDLPEDFTAVTSGVASEPTEEALPGRSVARFRADVPSDGLPIAAGRWVVSSVVAGHVKVSTYFLADDAALAPLFLDAAVKDLARLESQLGAFPYPKFDIVENFFTTGYGYPSFTLLGRDVVRMGERALRPGYLDHEIAHGWWGNYVLVDPAEGNWCEGLTSYLTNVMSVELAEGPEAAARARRRISQRYSIEVGADADFPLSEFVTKTDDAGSSIGYGKASMVFHLARRSLGDEAFFQALRLVIARHGGRRAGWSDFEAAFEEVSGKSFDEFFEQWVRQPGLPEPTFAKVQLAGRRVDGTLREPGGYRVEVPVRLDLASGSSEEVSVNLSGGGAIFGITATGELRRMRLDPDFHVPRRLPPEALPPSLARTLQRDAKGGGPLCIYPSTPAGAPLEVAAIHAQLKDLAETAARESGGTILPDASVTSADLKASALLVLGTHRQNAITKRLAEFVRESGVDVLGDASFRAGERRWTAKRQALLASLEHPWRSGSTVTVFSPNGQEALDAGRFIFFHRWDTWVALDGGRAAARGEGWPEDPRWVVEPSGEDVEKASPGARVMRWVERLTAPEMEGRDTDGGDRPSSKLLADALMEMGLGPALRSGIGHAFGFFAIDVVTAPSLVLRPEGAAPVSHPIAPFHHWIPRPEGMDSPLLAGMPWHDKLPVERPVGFEWTEGLVFAGPARPESFKGLDLAGAAAVVVDDESTPGGRGGPVDPARWVRIVEQVKLHEGRALVVIRPDGEIFLPGFATYASFADSATTARFQSLRASAGERGVMRAAAGAQARASVSGLALPVVVAGPELLEALRREGGAVRGRRTWEGERLQVRFVARFQHVAGTNVVGVVQGSAPSGLVILSAHHDGLGFGADGTIFEGAVDNAAGVAVVLEVARRLAAHPPRASVAIALTSGEEWGLQGSRKLAADWPVQLVPSAVVNVDSVGQAGKPLHVIGASREPRIAEIVTRHARENDLDVGAGIDARADAHGSDHWPWVEQRVPAVTVFQADYKVINTAADTRALLDEATLARLADTIEAAVREIADRGSAVR